MIRFCIRHRRLVAVLWTALTAALIGAAATWPGPTADGFSLPGSESQRAAELLDGAAHEPPGALVVSAPSGLPPTLARDPATAGGAPTRAPAPAEGDAPAQDPATASAQQPTSPQDPVAGLIARMNAVPGVHVSPDDRRVSPDGTITSIPIDYQDQAAATQLKKLRDEFRPPPGTTVELSGDDFADFTPGGVTELVGLLAAAVVLVFAFRSLIAAAVPLIVGVIGVACGVALFTLLGHAFSGPAFSVYLTIMLGLGVGIDYALLIVTRFRTALEESKEVEEAVEEAMRTAGRSVLFAGLIVIATGAGILLLGPSLGGGVALAAGCGVLMVMLAALTLLPALLGMIGRRIDRFALPRRAEGVPLSYRWSRVVQRRPWLAGTAALVALVALALPATQLRVGWSDAGNRPVTDTTRRAHDLLAQGFGPGVAGPLILVSAGADLGGAVERAARTPGVAQAFPTGGRTAVVIPRTGPQDERTDDLIHRLRAGLPGPVLVTGSTAAALDYARHTADRLPWVVGMVLLAAFALLVPVFRSLVLPLKAIVVNLLSVGAAYGVVVAVFQLDVLGLGTGGPIDAWVPMMLFTITFGLSMDYEVFLLSRVREEYLRDRDNSRAVAAGLARTARVITAAATIMFCVFAAFGAFDDRALRVMGVGLAVAVLVDATVVRLVLVPAAMEVIGERNWWFPELTFRRLTPRRNRT
ncbi:MMPL family transporter [Nonomuraea rubra]|uniref:RND superfamily putative drug exporter n=1 Tax=Nonomuraea rubra TaxID=46180 RepID=A0A7X0NYY3_9ACTN|nr:MMPL family transporter [Nonomuraea rubra]MBB6552019.1 RND superfamily putative drug exporter [Nonomuraea rubra]